MKKFALSLFALVSFTACSQPDKPQKVAVSETCGCELRTDSATPCTCLSQCGCSAGCVCK